MSLKAGPPRVSHPIERRGDRHGTAPDPPYPAPRQRELAHEPLEVPLALRRHRHDDARRPLTEEYQVRAAAVTLQLDAGPDGLGPGHTTLAERHGEPTLRAVVGPPHEPGGNRGAAGLVKPALLLEVERRQRACHLAGNPQDKLGAPETHDPRPQERDPVALPLEPLRTPALGLVNEPRHAD